MDVLPAIANYNIGYHIHKLVVKYQLNMGVWKLLASVAGSLVSIIIAHFALKLYQRLWVRPKKIEKQLKELGFKGNPYRFLHGDMKEFFAVAGEATSKPMDFSHDIGARVLPYEHHIVKKHGKYPVNSNIITTSLTFAYSIVLQ